MERKQFYFNNIKKIIIFPEINSNQSSIRHEWLLNLKCKARIHFLNCARLSYITISWMKQARDSGSGCGSHSGSFYLVNVSPSPSALSPNKITITNGQHNNPSKHLQNIARVQIFWFFIFVNQLIIEFTKSAAREKVSL